MDKNDSYFYISGFISLSLFTVFLFLFILLVGSSNKVTSFALNKDSYISVSIDIPIIQEKSSKKSVKQKQSEKKVVPKKSEDISIDNLFSDVWAQSIKKTKPKPKPKQVNKRRLQEINNKIKKSKVKEVSSLSQKVKNIETTKASKEDKKTSSASEVNEYLAKIQAIVYDNFYPPANSYGNSVKAVIELSSIGKVEDFRILTYSSNASLNEECDRIKGRIIGLVFPQNPEYKSGVYKITLVSKE